MRHAIKMTGFLLIGGMTQAQNTSTPPGSEVTTLGLGSAVTIHQVLSRADLALVKSAIQPNLLKGEFAEAVHSRSIAQHLR